MNSGIIVIDLHGKNTYQAKIILDSALRKADKAVYRLRIIHGHQSGTAIKDMISEDYGNHHKVIRLHKINDSITDLILREL